MATENRDLFQPFQFGNFTLKNRIVMANPMALFSYVVEQLNQFNIAYIHFIEGATMGPRTIPSGFSFEKLRQLFKGLYIANNGYDLPLALQARANNLADLICFGRPFLANPDLVIRLQTGAKLAEAPKDTWYGGGAKGYIDWPTLEEETS
ncbi:MAG: hypothetical protein V4501_05820 [Pseudomonadota bacterium]